MLMGMLGLGLVTSRRKQESWASKRSDGVDLVGNGPRSRCVLCVVMQCGGCRLI